MTRFALLVFPTFTATRRAERRLQGRGRGGAAQRKDNAHPIGTPRRAELGGGRLTEQRVLPRDAVVERGGASWTRSGQ